MTAEQVLKQLRAVEALKQAAKQHTAWMLDTSSAYPEHIHNMAEAIRFAIEALTDKGNK